MFFKEQNALLFLGTLSCDDNHKRPTPLFTLFRLKALKENCSFQKVKTCSFFSAAAKKIVKTELDALYASRYAIWREHFRRNINSGVKVVDFGVIWHRLRAKFFKRK